MQEWKPIIAGVDATVEGAWAGATAWRLAERVGTSCHLVHAVPTAWPVGVSGPADTVDAGALRGVVLDSTRKDLERALRGNMPEEALARLILRIGRPARVIGDVAAEVDAGLVVLGARRHHVLSRWLGGSTIIAAARTLETPLLVATSSTAKIERILVAVDLSEAAGPTIQMAERFARHFDAALRVVHVIEPVPLVADNTISSAATAMEDWTTEVLDASVWPLVTYAGAERVVLHGTTRSTLDAEVGTWRADLVVAGSHGRGWIDRTLLGSVTEGLLKDLPTSLLVVPVAQHLALGTGHEAERMETIETS